MPRSRPASATRSRRLGALYTDTILHDARVLKFVIEMIGTDRLMMGSDMPFPIGDTEPLKIVADAGLSAAQAASINGGLAARLFRYYAMTVRSNTEEPGRRTMTKLTDMRALGRLRRSPRSPAWR